ncbi:MAG: type II secretion system F family protein [Verrucomicrobiales bacterium]
MSLLVTPSQLNKRSDFYHQLASLVRAGVPIIQALEMIHKAPPGRGYKEPLAALIQYLQSGLTFTESVRRLGEWMPEFDVALTEAGELSGRLDSILTLLATHYKDRAQLIASVISDLLYPIFVVHLALLVFPPNLLAPLVWEGKVMPFVIQKLSVFVPLYIFVFLAILSTQGKRSERWRGLIEQFTSRLPLFGNAAKQMALARFTASLEALITAGVSIVESWVIAARASGSMRLKKSVNRMIPRIQSGDSPGEAVQLEAHFPELFRSLYRTGEISGQIDTTLQRLHQHYHHEANAKFKKISEWTPRLVLMLILLLGGYFVIRFWMNYYESRFDISL